jgi:hypothetical protein
MSEHFSTIDGLRRILAKEGVALDQLRDDG